MNFDLKPRSLEACWLSDRPCFEVAKRDADRRPIKLGKALPEAVRATFILVDGTHADITLHREAFDGMTPAGYPKLWQRVLQGFLADRTNPHTRQQLNNGILGLLRARPWSDIHDRL